MSDKPERERSRSPKGQGGPGNTESCDQPELDIPTPMPPSDLFEAVERGGGGDCAFLSIAQCLAAAGNKPTAADLAPGGKLQAYLRCKASKYMREHASDFSHISEASTLTDEIAKPGTWANSVSLTALALELKLQLRIWAWDKALRKWNRGTFISLVRPRLDPPRKKAKRPMAMRCPFKQTWFGCDCMISTTSGCGHAVLTKCSTKPSPLRRERCSFRSTASLGWCRPSLYLCCIFLRSVTWPQALRSRLLCLQPLSGCGVIARTPAVN